MSERAKAGQYSKGDRVYVKFAIDDFEIIGGNSYRKAVGVFEGEGTVDRAEDGYVFGRLDNGKTFMCNDSDAKPIEVNAYCKGFDKSLMFICIVFAAVIMKLSGV